MTGPSLDALRVYTPDELAFLAELAVASDAALDATPSGMMRVISGLLEGQPAAAVTVVVYDIARIVLAYACSVLPNDPPEVAIESMISSACELGKFLTNQDELRWVALTVANAGEYLEAERQEFVRNAAPTLILYLLTELSIGGSEVLSLVAGLASPGDFLRQLVDLPDIMPTT